ncbi:MAG: CPBP family intramembrane metalloprotease, partial [Chloroflexi bacterium]
MAAVLAALAVGLVDVPANMLAYWLTPDALDAISAIVDKTQLGLGLALVFAVLAGISEEVLFRGALQPRAGIVITALLFTAIHVHYGATPVAASVFVAGLAYGWLRRHMNTTTAIMAHATTDIAASLPSGFARFGLLFVAVAIAFAAIRAEGYSWSRYLVPPAVAGVFLVLGSG